MSDIIRQSRLFAGEDFTKVYRSFKDINFTSYDFESIRESLITYLQTYYPEDFNDYIESSEFVAIIELLSYLGTSLSLRIDINSRENIIDTADRRESIIRLAKLINYQTKRNIAASGLLKITSIKTDQPITDSNGNALSNVTVTWNDPNNLNWYDQFVTVLNSALNRTNPFGRPSASKQIGGIQTSLYELNNITGLNVSYPMNVTVNGESFPIDIINPMLSDTIDEKHPDPDNPFSLIYRNDSLGESSANTGLFLKFVQGKLQRQDDLFEFPEPNRIWDIRSSQVNNSDVYVQEINDLGKVINKWVKVPAVTGSNVIYNSLRFSEENIFEVITELNDKISIKFADGNFGNVPTGTFRVWFRTSAGKKVVFRPENMSGLKLSLPYVGADGQEYKFTMTFSLQNSVSNGVAAEANDQIKTRAPQVYYTQDRMVNREDYNVFPLTQDSSLLKVKAINRTYSGHSRFRLNDPTGYHSEIELLGSDGAIYDIDDKQRQEVILTPSVIGSLTSIMVDKLERFLDNKKLYTFFYNRYLPETNAYTGLDFNMSGLYWKSAPNRIKSNSGFLIMSLERSDDDENWPYGPNNFDNVKTLPASLTLGQPQNGLYYVSPGSTLTFRDGAETKTVVVKSVNSLGKPNPDLFNIGPIKLSAPVPDTWELIKVTPPLRTVLNEVEAEQVRDRVRAADSFKMVYLLTQDRWEILDFEGVSDDVDFLGWLVYVQYVPGTEGDFNRYVFVSRGSSVVFESRNSVRFFWDPELYNDSARYSSVKTDTIDLLVPMSQNGVCKFDYVKWDLNDRFVQDDGYVDFSKVKVLPSDLDTDGLSDKPDSFINLPAVLRNQDVLTEKFVNADGYTSTRLWTGKIYELPEEKDDDNDVVIRPVGLSEVVSLNYDEMTVDILVGTNPRPVELFDYDLFVMSDEMIQGVPKFLKQLSDLMNDRIVNGSDVDRVAVETAVGILRNKAFKVMPVNTGQTYLDNIDLSQYRNMFFNLLVQRDAVGDVSVVVISDSRFKAYKGMVFNQNSDKEEDPLYFRWKHYVPNDQRIDASKSNIIDVIALTEEYFTDVTVWKNGSRREKFPAPPSTESLRIKFAGLNTFKSISDELIFNSCNFKILFGAGADEELKAKFKVIKIPSVSISDNELKTRIVQAIDRYFDISNWDFGERFYYTELAAYIHGQLSKFISSVVIVPVKASSEFGNLFEIMSNPNELFISTATVANVEIVSNYTDTNLRM